MLTIDKVVEIILKSGARFVTVLYGTYLPTVVEVAQLFHYIKLSATVTTTVGRRVKYYKND